MLLRKPEEFEELSEPALPKLEPEEPKVFGEREFPVEEGLPKEGVPNVEELP